MGIVLILLGLAAAGVLVDFAVENWSAGAPDVSSSLFGGSFTTTQVQVVIGAAVLGAIAIALLVLGARLLRGSRGRRRTTKHTIENLERENAALKDQHHDEPTDDVHVQERVVVESQR